MVSIFSAGHVGVQQGDALLAAATPRIKTKAGEVSPNSPPSTTRASGSVKGFNNSLFCWSSVRNDFMETVHIAKQNNSKKGDGVFSVGDEVYVPAVS